MSDTPKIRPAISPEEWAEMLSDPSWWEYRTPQQGGWSAKPRIESRHGIAAAALYGQPFGFTREHVGAIAIAAQTLTDLSRDAATEAERAALDTVVGHLYAAADRIAALLPP